MTNIEIAEQEIATANRIAEELAQLATILRRTYKALKADAVLDMSRQLRIMALDLDGHLTAQRHLDT